MITESAWHEQNVLGACWPDPSCLLSTCSCYTM